MSPMLKKRSSRWPAWPVTHTIYDRIREDPTGRSILLLWWVGVLEDVCPSVCMLFTSLPESKLAPALESLSSDWLDRCRCTSSMALANTLWLSELYLEITSLYRISPRLK